MTTSGRLRFAKQYQSFARRVGRLVDRSGYRKSVVVVFLSVGRRRVVREPLTATAAVVVVFVVEFRVCFLRGGGFGYTRLYAAMTAAAAAYLIMSCVCVLAVRA